MRKPLLLPRKLLVLFSLLIIKRTVQHLKLQSLRYIRSVTKPNDNFITHGNTFVRLSCLIIKIRKLKCPLLDKIGILHLFQNTDLLANIGTLSLGDMVSQDVLFAIMRCDIDKLLEVLFRFINLIHFHAHQSKMIKYHPANRRPLVCKCQKHLRVFNMTERLIQITNLNQRIDISYLTPINAVE